MVQIKSFFTIALLSLTGLSHAFTLNNNVGASFDRDIVKINVAAHTCSNIGVTNDELLSLAGEAAALYWNRVHTSSLELAQGEIQSVAAAFQTDLVCSNAPASTCTINSALVVSSDILISCNNNGTNFSNSPSVLGVTVPNNVSGQTINGALILVNDQASNSFKNLSRQERIAVIAHEIGHAVGLGHSSFENNLMYFQSVATRVALGWDDVDGITYLYPMEQPFDDCGTAPLIGPSKGPKNDNHDHSSHGGGSGSGGAPKNLMVFFMALLLALGLGRLYKATEKTWQKSAL